MVGDSILYEQRSYIRTVPLMGEKTMSDIKAKNPVTGELETRDSDSWKTEMKDDGLYFLADHDMADLIARADEEAAHDLVNQWEALRGTRNTRLSETDWWASSDLTMTDDQKAYRQALRDLPANTSDPFNVTWPEKP